MQRTLKTGWIILIICGLFIKIFSIFPHAIERYYANGIYPVIARAQRLAFGWIPFSMGDIFYSVLIIYFAYKLVLFVKAIFQKRVTKILLFQHVKSVVFFCLLVYVLFNLLWGLNYNRLPMAQQMDLSLERYSTKNLSHILEVLKSRLDTFDSSEYGYRQALKSKKTLFRETIDSYLLTAKQYPALSYHTPSVKPSIFSYAGNYLGFTGYYNPFSGEAQANTTIPFFIQPFTTCHEIGHQLGYAKENEANFAGFLAARSSPNPAFRYSVYFEMYAYASSELFRRDSVLAKTQDDRLSLRVKNDFESIRRFYLEYQNPLEPVIRRLYARYLKANEQPEGLRSYNEVVAMLMAYYKKYGKI